jgi:Pentapeptide repeats (8 copies)
VKSRLAGLWRTHRAAVLIIGGLAAVLMIVALFWPVTDVMAAHDVDPVAASQRAAHLQTAREAVRTQFLTLAAGLAVVGTLWFTGQNFRLSRQGQVTDRYTRAIEQLGSGKLDVRIGAVYALERIARDSATDHPTVMEVLAAFIREHSRERWVPGVDKPGAKTPRLTAPPDMQAAIAVIGRRDTRRDQERIDLNSANLNAADFFRARFPAANFVGAHLIGADMMSADLTGADLTDANLTGADLTDADLTGADLTYADLTDADLTYANLNLARLAVDAPVPDGWVRDPGSGRLSRAHADGDESGK